MFDDDDVGDAAADIDSCFAFILLIDDITAVKTDSADGATSAENKTEDIVDRKLNTVHSGKQFACNDCDFTTDQHGHYKRHLIRSHHGNSEKPATYDKKFVPANDLNSYLRKT